jgi:diphthamide synthase (EF-2-diphthine--ammonia ligase)
MATAVSFTGGKDSVLALHLACEAHSHPLVPELAPPPPPVTLLVTFAPPGADFKAHPLPIIRAAAAALGLRHVVCEVQPGPDGSHLRAYQQQVASLRQEHGVTHLVTGDVLDVASGFMQKAVQPEDGGGQPVLQLVRPLWQLPRASVVQAGLDLGIRSRISCVDTHRYPGFDAVSTLLGQEVTRDLVAGPLAAAEQCCGADLAGERGEYHTLVFACPLMGATLLQLRPLRHSSLDSGHAFVEWCEL